jgi:hypothetical protein
MSNTIVVKIIGSPETMTTVLEGVIGGVISNDIKNVVENTKSHGTGLIRLSDGRNLEFTIDNIDHDDVLFGGDNNE